MTRPAPSRSLAVLTLILLIAAAFRLVALTRVPPGLQHDEVFHAHDAFTVRQGYTPLWFPSNAGNEPLYIYLMAASTALIGDTALGIRFTAVACGLLTIAFTYRWAAATFNRRVGIVAAAFMAVAFWPVWMGRVGLRAVSLPPLVALAGWLYSRTLTPRPVSEDERSTGSPSPSGPTQPTRAGKNPSQGRVWERGSGGEGCFALAGLALGLTLYTYPAALAVLLAFLAYYAYLLVFRRAALRRAPLGHALYWLVAALTALPLGLALRAAGGYPRVEQTAVPLAMLRAGDPGPLLDAALRTLGMWFVRGDPLWRYNVAGRPVFGPLLGAAFLIGVVACLWMALTPSPTLPNEGEGMLAPPLRKRWGVRPGGEALIPLFLLIGALPSAVTDSPPAFLRASAALPATFIALAVGFEAVYGWIVHRVRWIIPTLLALTAAFTIRDIFFIWGGNAEVQRIYRADLAAVAAYLEDHVPPGGVAISTSEPNHLDRFIFDYTPHGEVADIHWFDGLNALVAPAGEAPAWLFVTREPEIGARLRERYLDRLPWVEERRFENGSLAYALVEVPPGDAFLARFPPPTGQGVWVAEALAFPADDPAGIRAPLAYPVQLGDVLQLVGYESPPRSPANNWLPITLVFRVTRDVDQPEPWALFAHVLDAGGALVAGRDFLAVPASTWRAGDVFVQLHDVALGDLAPGLYHVEIGLYSQADGARFPVLVDGVAVGDRLLLEPVEVTTP